MIFKYRANTHTPTQANMNVVLAPLSEGRDKDEDKTLSSMIDERQLLQKDATIVEIVRSMGITTDSIFALNQATLADPNNWIGVRVRKGTRIKGEKRDGEEPDAKRRRKMVQATVHQTQVLSVSCGVCKLVQLGDGEGGQCTRCTALFTKTPGYPVMDSLQLRTAARTTHLGTATEVQDVRERMDAQRSHNHVTTREAEKTRIQQWAQVRGTHWLLLSPVEVAAYLSSSDNRGSTVFHHETCPHYRSTKLEKECDKACRKGTAPSSMATRQTILQAVYNGADHTGRWTASNTSNNPAQSNFVDTFVKKYRSESAKGGHTSRPRTPLLSTSVCVALVMARRRLLEAKEGTKKGSRPQRYRAGFEALKWAQMGAAIAIAHDAGQRGASMADVRADSVAILQQTGASVLIMNASMSKTRRDGQAAWFACRERGAAKAITCPVRWFRLYQEALKDWEGSAQAFTDRPGAKVFGKIWIDRSSGKAIPSFAPFITTTTAMFSERLQTLLKQGNQAVPHTGFASLRGGGALAAVLTHKRTIEEVMSTAEWKQVKTFQWYTHLHAVLGADKTVAPPQGCSPWSLMTENDYSVANAPVAKRDGAVTFADAIAV